MQRALPVKRPATGASQDPARWAAVPGLCCQAAGGDPARAEDLAVAWFCFYVAAHLLDNIEDRDALAGDLGGWPAGVPINLTTGLLFAAGLALDRLHFGDSGKPASHKIPGEFYRGFLTMCSGQHLDLITPQPNLEQWQQIAAAKSGVFFRLACWGGAALAIDRFEALESYGEFGFRLGLLLQLQDDLGDMQQAKAGQGDALISDNIERCLPIAYAREVLPPDKKIHLGVLLSQGAQDPVAAGSVIDLLDQCGADLYVLTEIERHMRLGIEALQSAGPRQPAGDTLAELLRHLGNGAFANS